MGDPKAFWDKHAEGYAKRKITNEEAYQRKIEETQTYLNEESKIFEFACGTGTTALCHAPLARQIDALDISPKMLEIAQAKADASGIKNVNFICGELDTFDGENGAYDMVMAHSILHLLNDKEGTLERFFQLLKPGGVFVSSTICLQGAMPWLKLVLPLAGFFGLLPKIQFFTEKELTDQFVKTGFVIESSWQPTKTQSVFIIARKPDLLP